MAEDDRAPLAGMLLPVALIALFMPALLGVVEQGLPPAPAPARDASARPDDDFPTAERLLNGHLNRRWRGAGDPALRSLDFLIATVPDPVVSRLDYTFDRYVDALQRAVEAADYRLDRFDLPWTRLKASTDALEEVEEPAPDADADATAGSKTGLTERQPEFTRHPAVLLFTRRAASGVSGLVVYLVSETPTTGVNQAALTVAFDEIADLCWARRSTRPFAVDSTCSTRTIKMLGPSFSGSRRSLEIALAQWPGRTRLHPDRPFQLVSGSVTSTEPLEALPPGTLRSTALPDAAFLTGIVHYLTNDLGASCSQIAFLTEGSAFGQNLRAVLDGWRRRTDGGQVEWGEPCQVLSLRFPMHLAELRREASRARAQKTAAPSTLLSGDDQHIPLAERGGRIDRSVLGMMSIDEAASSELVLRGLLSTIAQERVRYVGLISTDVRDRLFLAREIQRYAPHVVLFLYGADMLYLHPDYNVALRGALVVTPYPLFSANQLWTAPFDGGEHRSIFPVSTAQGVYNAALALLGCDSHMLEYGRPFAANQPQRRPALWLTAVGKSGFAPVTLLDDEETRNVLGTPNAQNLVYESGQLAQSPSLLPCQPLPTTAETSARRSPSTCEKSVGSFRSRRRRRCSA